MAKRSRTLRFKLLLALALVLVVGWSVLWFVCAGVVDRQADRIEMRAERDGTMINCAQRSVKGYPFRIEVRCGPETRIASADGTVTIGGLTLAGQLYEPSLLIAELRSPLAIDVVHAPAMAAEWDLARASARLDFTDRSLRRFDAEVRGGAATLAGAPRVTADEVHVNVRRKPDAPEDLDVAVRLIRAVPIPGQAPVTLLFRGEMPGAAPLLAGHGDRVVGRLHAGGLSLVIDKATVECGDMLVGVDGTLTLRPDGLMDGDLSLAIAGLDAGVPYAGVLPPIVQDSIAALQKVLPYVPDTTIGGRTAKKIPITIRAGRARAGIIPLPMTIPSISLPS